MVLEENEIVDEAALLSNFKISFDSTHENLKKVLDNYEKLLRKYRSLKSDFEEEKENREKYKKLARGQERHPFVLVLIDGDGYVFNDKLIKDEAEGGARAAQLLREAVTAHLSNEERNCAIVCKVYADLAKLSSRLAFANIGKPHSRANGPFAAAFTRSQQHFDFIDCGDNVDNAPDKLIDSLRLFAGPGQCKKIFLACAQRDRYVEPLKAMLQRYPERQEQLILIRPPEYNAEFDFLRVPIVEFPTVFRPIPLAPGQPSAKSRLSETSKFAKDHSRYGNELSRYASHGSGPKDDGEPSRYATSAAVSKWGKAVASSTPTSLPYRAYGSPETPSIRSTTPATELLPSPPGSFRDQIPLNRDGQRIDAYIHPPSVETIKHYQARSRPIRPCNDFHLRSTCPKGTTCPYDHRPIDESCTNAMRYYLRHTPCPRGNDCRDLTCLKGHHCQHFSCPNGKKSVKCKFSRLQHDQDLKIYEWVSPDKEATFDAETMIDVNDDVWDRSSVQDVANLQDMSPLDAPVEMSKQWANDLSALDGPNIWTPIPAQSYSNGLDSLTTIPGENEAHGDARDQPEFPSANCELANGEVDHSYEESAETKESNGENDCWNGPHSNGENDLWDQPHLNGENDLWDHPYQNPETEADNFGQRKSESWRANTPEKPDFLDESRPETPKNSGGGWHTIVIEGFETTDNTKSWNNQSRSSQSHKWNNPSINGPSVDDDVSVNSFLGSPIRHTSEHVNGNANNYTW